MLSRCLHCGARLIQLLAGRAFEKSFEHNTGLLALGTGFIIAGERLIESCLRYSFLLEEGLHPGEITAGLTQRTFHSVQPGQKTVTRLSIRAFRHPQYGQGTSHNLIFEISVRNWVSGLKRFKRFITVAWRRGLGYGTHSTRKHRVGCRSYHR